MSKDSELDSFLSSLTLQLSAVRREALDPWRLAPESIVTSLTSLGATDLAVETAELPNSLLWLSSVVRVCAGYSPSIAFALAGRYAGQRVGGKSASPAITATVATGDGESAWRATVPAVLAPTAVVLLDRRGPAARIVPWEGLQREAPAARTGLRDADLRTVTPLETDDGATMSTEQAATALFELDLLNASIALGILEFAVATSQEYASTRRQFGSPIASFAGLASILVDMRLKAATVRGLMTDALETLNDDGELAAVAGRACVDACLDAIQVHGGYGYIDEYPVSGLLRDALSLRARGGGRRSAVAAVAAAHLQSA